jgi:hypothetical protein
MAANGAEKCLVCRTDMMPIKASMLDGFDWLMEKFPLEAEAQKRQKGRIIAPNLFTRRFIPYHVSDLFTYGWREDVAAFWGASSPDDRPDEGSAYLPQGMETPLDICVRNKIITENYFWLNYIEKIGRKPLFTVADGLSFLKDYVLIVDLHAQQILWTSKAFHDHGVLCTRYKACMSFADWTELSYASQVSAKIDLTKVLWQDFTHSLGL